MKEKISNLIVKVMFIVLLLNLTIFLNAEVNAATYGKDYFEEEYSNGYIRNCSSSNVIRTSSGISVQRSSIDNLIYYTSNNRSKSEYIDYSQAARYINNVGEAIWLDMRIYVWTNNSSYPWNICTSSLLVGNLSKTGIQHTQMEFHFYTIGHCGDSNYEQSFKGVMRVSDLDPSEGVLIYSGYNKCYLRAGTPLINVFPGNANSNSTRNPFSTSGTSLYPYFVGTRENNDYDNVWIEVNSTSNSPFSIIFGTKNTARGANIFYTGTAIEYYIDGVLKDTSYCVPYGKYKLINPRKMDSSKEGYTVDGWYTDATYTAKAQNGIAGESTIKVYGKSIPDKRYTITVDNDREGHTYNSYQVFQGDYFEKIDDNGNKIPTLSNIEWGEELQRESEEGKTHGDKILELLKEKNLDLYKDCNTAEDVTQVLQGKSDNGDAIKEFTNIVGKYILDNNIQVTNGTSTVVQEKDSNGNVIDANYKITRLEPGYYIVIDVEANEKDDAYSRYLIDVVQDVTMYPKTATPKLTKKVNGNNVKKLVEGTGTSEENSAQYIDDEKRNTAIYKEASEIYNAEDYDIEFELKSYIPDLEGYSTYEFEVVDILAKGFDYDRNSVKIMLDENTYPQTRINDAGEKVSNYAVNDVVITDLNYEIYKNYFEEEGKEYPENFAESNYGKTLILIELNDLVEQMNEEIVTKGQDVIIKYNVKLNGKGEVGVTPNINEAYLKYSNDPYHNEKITQTTTQTTYTYTIDLNLSKIAELKDETFIKNYLEGAEFEIYDGPEYIKGDLLLPTKNPNRKLIATITTDEMGKGLYSSLGEGTYYIKETKAPEGYNKLKEEIEIEIIVTCDELGTITWTVKNAENNLILAQIGLKEGTEIPEIKLQVENTSGLQLPVTGGTGTVIFTVIGLNIMIVAVISLKINNKIK